ncbi:DUF4238 domain-containing protein [uncultured Parvibaculum sp.]|uniref:DUF4238 domain-containing protein n=1 Tax=uncultured Parvibaculum sp. TaxID=291828 RepID=UPI0030DD44B4
MTAQNQHYIPKFILRQFLENENKERVAVYDKHTEKVFITSIRNIMAERRFHDFAIDDWETSFEPIATKIENEILPVYQKILKTRHLENSKEERDAISVFIAFQFLRTRARRDAQEALDKAIKGKIEQMGGDPENVQGWKAASDEEIKIEHLLSMARDLDRYAQVVRAKDFLLIEAKPNQSFYLGDAAVGLANQNDFGPYGNIGLAVVGIEIYVPLSSNLILAAWCPSIVEQLKEHRDKAKKQAEKETFEAMFRGRISTEQMKEILDFSKSTLEFTNQTISHIANGMPLPCTDENLEYYNSIQCIYAHRYIICKNKDFAIAKRHNKEFPKFRHGSHPVIS